MTAKEKLLREVLDLDEAEAAAARIVIERRSERADEELDAMLDEEAGEMLDEMDAEEQKARLRTLEDVSPTRGRSG